MKGAIARIVRDFLPPIVARQLRALGSAAPALPLWGRDGTVVTPHGKFFYDRQEDFQGQYRVFFERE
ncbi:MAG: hypothetical protein NDJ92_18065, partial [Thermoanaerobaculia bacterium]|nr:hypothetical protein [Thermoanaerobaculia bacterium]